MAKLLGDNQRIITGVTTPAAVYSRWVGFSFPVTVPAGSEQWEVTGPLAQSLWLLQAKLILTATNGGGLIECCWRIATCTFVPPSAEVIATQLEPVVDVRWLNKPYACYGGGDREFCFEMKRLYEGAGRRFAVWVQNNSDTVKIWVTACFLISEG